MRTPLPGWQRVRPPRWSPSNKAFWLTVRICIAPSNRIRSNLLFYSIRRTEIAIGSDYASVFFSSAWTETIDRVGVRLNKCTIRWKWGWQTTFHSLCFLMHDWARGLSTLTVEAVFLCISRSNEPWTSVVHRSESKQVGFVRQHLPSNYIREDSSWMLNEWFNIDVNKTQMSGLGSIHSTSHRFRSCSFDLRLIEQWCDWTRHLQRGQSRELSWKQSCEREQGNWMRSDVRWRVESEGLGFSWLMGRPCVAGAWSNQHCASTHFLWATGSRREDTALLEASFWSEKSHEHRRNCVRLVNAVDLIGDQTTRPRARLAKACCSYPSSASFVFQAFDNQRAIGKYVRLRQEPAGSTADGNHIFLILIAMNVIRTRWWPYQLDMCLHSKWQA